MNKVVGINDSYRDSVIEIHFLKASHLVLLFLALISFYSCITEFIPETSADQDLIVVGGIITDQPGPKSITISTSLPLGGRSSAKPVSGCNVTITDDLGNIFTLEESTDGTYTTNSLFQTGRSYMLHIKTGEAHHNLSYESAPMLLKPVPAIDSVYYEKDVLSVDNLGATTGEGIQIFLNSHNPDNNCRFYRWEYVETWEIRLPYTVKNHVCWVTRNSDQINIKNTSAVSEDRIDRQLINFVTNQSDRLLVKYSILVNQYSLNEDEYAYWEKVKNTVEEVGSLYDIVPSSIPSNIKCIQRPADNVLGYFSVSSVKSKRIFTHDRFRGMPNIYTDCENVTVGFNDYVEGLDYSLWVIIEHPEPPPGYKVLTYFKSCADCTVRGTTQKPEFWIDEK
jgi:hypothetical protein